jgi:SAM-dependent methyltransferase
MKIPTNLQKYLKKTQLEKLFKELGATEPKTLAKTVRHFTTKEAEKRDRIVTSYFGHKGINRIVNAVAKLLLEPPKPPRNGKILDIGAGTGFFTLKIAEKIRSRVSEVSFYAMDPTPAMLLELERKNADITPFIGIAENIGASVKAATAYVKIPSKFDAVFSTLMLHHSVHPEEVFGSLKTVLKRNGKAIIVDLCEHGFEEFKTEMGDIHLGFKPEKISEMGREHFTNVRVQRIPGVHCASSGRSAELFVVSMRKGS